MFRSRARTSIVALAAAAALVTAGCGVDQADDGALTATGQVNSPDRSASPSVPGPVEPGRFEGTGGVVYLQQAADATASMDTMSMAMDIEMAGMPMFGDIRISAEGSIDSKGELAHMTMDMTDMFALAGSLGGGGEVPDDAGIIEMIVDGDTTYMKSSMFSVVPGADPSKPWFSAPSDDVSDSETFGQSSSDPKEFLEFLRNSGSDVTEVGVEELRGVETTHLRTVLDPKAMVESASDDERAELEESLDGLGADGIMEIPVDVWVDADGMVRKMVMTMDMSDVEDESGMSMSGVSITISVEMFDFGEPVEIDVPDPSEVQAMDPSMLQD